MRRAFAAAALALLLAAPPGRVHAQPVAEPDTASDRLVPEGTTLDAPAEAERDTSADGRWIVFVQATPDSTVEGPVGVVERTRLVLVERASGRPRTLLLGGTRTLANGSPLANFDAACFAPDGRTIYFTSAAYVTSDAAIALDVASGRTREICGANSLALVRRGRWAGDLVVEQHRYHAHGGAYDWLYVVNPQGRTLLTLGDPDDPKVMAHVNALLAGREK